MNLVRHEHGLSEKGKRFPLKATCLSIYSRVVNAQAALATVLAKQFPWCTGSERELKDLFAAYVEAKQQKNVLDYDDLLLYWAEMMAHRAIAAAVANARGRRCAEGPGGPVPCCAPQRRTRDRACPAQHPVRQVRRAAPSRSRTHQGRPECASLRREPEGPGCSLSGCAAAARHRPEHCRPSPRARLRACPAVQEAQARRGQYLHSILTHAGQ